MVISTFASKLKIQCMLERKIKHLRFIKIIATVRKDGRFFFFKGSSLVQKSAARLFFLENGTAAFQLLSIYIPESVSIPQIPVLLKSCSHATRQNVAAGRRTRLRPAHAISNTASFASVFLPPNGGWIVDYQCRLRIAEQGPVRVQRR